MIRTGIIVILVGLLSVLVGVVGAEEIVLQSSPVAHPVKVEPVRAAGDPVNLVLDDGSVENNLGIGGTAEFIEINRFTPTEFPLEITQVDVYFADGTNLAVGDTFDVYLWENTAGNTDPAVGANYIGGETGNSIAALDAWATVGLNTPLQFNGPGGDILVGIVYRETPGTSTYPSALDTTASQTRSWIGWYSATTVPDPPTLPPDDTWNTIDNIGFPGNWLLRASGTVLPVELLSFSVN